MQIVRCNLLDAIGRVSDTTDFISPMMTNIIANSTVTEKIIDLIMTENYMLHDNKKIFDEISDE